MNDSRGDDLLRQPTSLSRASRLLLSLAVFLYFLITAPRGLFWLDAGDFVSAAFELGVPHPTGFPLYIMLAKAFTTLPFGSVAFRLSLFSAATAGAATAMFVTVLRQLLPKASERVLLVSAILGLACWWLTDVAGLMGRTQDVYVLQAFLALAAVWATTHLLRGGSLRWAWLQGFIVGLGMSNHAEFRLFAPLLLGAALWGLCKTNGSALRGSLLPGILGWGLMASAGMLPYLQTAISARRPLYHNWGYPDTWARLWDHFWGSSIRLAYQSEFISFSSIRLNHHLSHLSTQIWNNLGPILLLSALGFIVLGLRKRVRALYSLLLVMALVDLGYAVLINPMGLREDQNGGTLIAIISLFTACGMVWLTESVGRLALLSERSRQVVFALLVTAVLVGNILGRMEPERHWLAGRWCAEELTFTAIQSADTGSLLLSGTEAFVAARLYLVGVGGLRPDQQNITRHELSSGMLLAHRSREGPFALADAQVIEQWATEGIGASEERTRARLALILHQARNDGRTILWGSGGASDAEGLFERLLPSFPLSRLSESPVAPEAWTGGFSRAMAAAATLADDPWGRLWVAEYLNWLGHWAHRLGSIEHATTSWVSAAELAPNWPAPKINLAVIAASGGDFALAARLVTEVLARNPTYARGWFNLAGYRCVLGEAQAARTALQRGAALDSTAAAVRDLQEALFPTFCP